MTNEFIFYVAVPECGPLNGANVMSSIACYSSNTGIGGTCVLECESGWIHSKHEKWGQNIQMTCVQDPGDPTVAEWKPLNVVCKGK